MSEKEAAANTVSGGEKLTEGIHYALTLLLHFLPPTGWLEIHETDRKAWELELAKMVAACCSLGVKRAQMEQLVTLYFRRRLEVMRRFHPNEIDEFCRKKIHALKAAKIL